MNLRSALVATAVVVALPLFGCSVLSGITKSPTDTLEGSSKSISGAFDALSRSSGSGGTASPNLASYRRDLRQYAAVFATSEGGTREDFLRGVSRIAEDHGVSHWEAEPLTPRAIGEGLRDANLSEAEMDAFVNDVGRDKPAAQLALEGYRSPGS